MVAGHGEFSFSASEDEEVVINDDNKDFAEEENEAEFFLERMKEQEIENKKLKNGTAQASRHINERFGSFENMISAFQDEKKNKPSMRLAPAKGKNEIKVNTVLKSNEIINMKVSNIMDMISKTLNEKFCQSTFFEIIDGPCRAYIDIDRVSSAADGSDLRKERNQIVDNIYATLKGYDIVIIDGSRMKGKSYYISLHVIFKDLYFSSGAEVGKFMLQFKNDLQYDSSVYKAAGKIQKMRLPYCGKESPSSLSYMKILENKKRLKFKNISLEQYSDCCITLIPEDAVFSDIQIPGDVNCLTLGRNLEQIPGDVKQNEEFPFLKNFRKLLPNTEILGRGRLEKNLQIIDLGKPADVCPFAGRQHKNNRNYVVYDIKKGTYSLRCFDEECVNRSKLIFKPKPEAVKFNLPEDQEEEDIIYKKLLNMAYDQMILGDFNDVGLASIFSEEFTDKIKITGCDGNGYFWDGTRWNYYSSVTLQSIIPACFETPMYRVLDKLTNIINDLDAGQDKELAFHSSIKRALKASYKRINSKSCIKNIFELVRVETSPLYMKKNIFDTNPDLVGFENGVFDLDTSEFRPYKKTDYITASCGYDYRLPTDEEKKEWTEFLYQIMPQEDERKYLMSILSTTIYGKALENLFLMVGNGRNGKDTLITSILENVLGSQYYYNAQSSLLTAPIKTGACPEIANIGNKRCVVITEPDKKMTWKCANIKSLTGSKATCARGLYSSDTDTKICATFIVLCNAIPSADDVDNALGSRLKAIPFRAQFLTEERLNEMPADTPHIYKVDSYYKSDKFLENVKYAILADLIEAFKEFNDSGRVIQKDPPSIKELTREYLENCDEFLQWFKDSYEYIDDETQFIKFNEMFDKFKSSELYHNSSKMDKRRLTKKKMIEDISANPAIKGFYRARKKIHGVDHKNIILKHRLREKEDENDSEYEQ